MRTDHPGSGLVPSGPQQALATAPISIGSAGAEQRSDDLQPPTQIGPDTNLKWKVAVPPGASSPVVARDRIFITAFEDGKLFTIAYRQADVGAWNCGSKPRLRRCRRSEGRGSPAASTPATDGERLVAYFGSYGLVCYDTAGKELWKHELPAGETFQGFGTGSSPVITGGRVVLLRDLERAGRLLCLDKTTGAQVWEAKRDGYRTSWGSACVWDTPTGKHVVVAGGLRLQGYDLGRGGSCGLK